MRQASTARILRGLMRRYTSNPEQTDTAHALLASEFAQALEHDPNDPVSTPGYVLLDEVPAVELVHRLIELEPDHHTLGQLLAICANYAPGDLQALAVLQSLAVRFAADQVSRMVTAGAIEAGTHDASEHA